MLKPNRTALVGLYQEDLKYARQLDLEDPLRGFRSQFHFPPHGDGKSIYFCGNSLGLQPKGTAAAIQEELDRWSELAVEGHFKGALPWMDYHKALQQPSAEIVGATESEVVVMNTLTVNLHLMMVTFYRPTQTRFKIIMEAGAFPSDQYAIASQVKHHGLDPKTAIVEVAPRPGEETLRTEDIIATIEREGPETALVLFGGLNYYTGQVFDMPAITDAGHRVGAYVGFDLAHAAGNIILHLHDWKVDFAIWCTYKYLNSGPGSLGGVFIHEQHAFNAELPRFAGWWGHDEERRFLMEKAFTPIKGAAGWQLSNAPILAMPAMKVSHDLFMQAGIPALRQKSIKLTGYLEYHIDQLNKKGANFRIITPRDPNYRGAQLSFLTGTNGKALFNYLLENGVICDWREHTLPGASAENEKAGVIRIAPAPIYNSFEDVWQLAELLKKAVS